MRRILLTIAIVASVASAAAQEYESTPADPGRASSSYARGAVDPVANRVLLMPTGSLVSRSRLYIGNVGLLGLASGYTPSEYMQINAGAFYSPTTSFPSFATAGVKVQVIKPDDWFHGLSAGADFGFLYTGNRFDYRGSIQSYTLATSVGNDEFEGHFATVAYPYSTYDKGRLDVRFMLQSGVTIPFDNQTGERGMKAMAEFWAGGRSFNSMRTIFAAAGIRNYSWNFTWELGIATGPRCYGNCTDNDLVIYPFPFGGVTLFL